MRSVRRNALIFIRFRSRERRRHLKAPAPFNGVARHLVKRQQPVRNRIGVFRSRLCRRQGQLPAHVRSHRCDCPLGATTTGAVESAAFDGRTFFLNARVKGVIKAASLSNRSVGGFANPKRILAALRRMHSCKRGIEVSARCAIHFLLVKGFTLKVAGSMRHRCSTANRAI